MKQTILLGNEGPISVAFTMWGSIFLGLTFIANGIYYLDSETFGIFLLMIGILTIIYSLLAFTKFSKLSPKVKLNDSHLILRSSVIKKPMIFTWAEISKIRFHSYQIDIILDKETIEFTYRTNSKISVKIKEAIRDIADSKNIETLDG